MLGDERGKYHLLHFDGHGFYEDKLGLGGLAFEDAEHKTHLVTAKDLGDLLNRRGIALAMLDACRTGREVETAAFSSVAAQLITSGVGSVISMSYSVLVEAAHIFTQRFYQELVAGKTVGAATRAARESLKTNPFRIVNADAKRGLVDWFLPLLYQRGKDAAPFDPTPQPPSLQRKGESSPLPKGEGLGVQTSPLLQGEGLGVRFWGFPDAPRDTFIGRSYELLQVERALLDQRVVVLHGFGGVGKTALSREAAVWLTRTGMFPGGAVFVSFEQGMDAERAVYAVGEMFEGAAFSQKSPQERLQTVEAYLKDHPTLVVWDNFESVYDNAITLPALRQEILKLGARWAELRGPGGTKQRSSLLITTRQSETDLPGAVKVALGGFSPRDALDFAAKILGQEGIDRGQLDRAKLQQLMDLLGNHALSLALVLPQLHKLTLDQMLEEFETLLPGFTTGAGKERNESLQVSLEFSLKRLGQTTRDLLPALAVFQGGALEYNILAITEIPEETWNAVRPELVRAALIRVEEIPGINPLFIHFHPTLAPHLARLLSKEQRAELEAKYSQAYYQFADYLYHADDKTPLQARALAVREMPNLKRALTLTPDAATAVDFADSIVRFLDVFGRWRERDAVMEQVTSKQLSVISEQSSVISGGKLTKTEFLLESRKGETLLSQGRAAEAEKVFRALLARIPPPLPPSPVRRGVGGEVWGYERCVTLQRLGRCLRAQGKPNAAADAYREALADADALEQTDGVRRMTGTIHTDLADVLGDAGQFDAARKEYEAALEIDEALGDARGAAVALGQLGTLALTQGDFAEARRRYNEALLSFRAIGEPQSEAIVWHQLGMVAQEQKDWDEAERCYKESLAIKERMGDKALAATTCNQLAIVTKGAGRLDEAERWYRRTLQDAELLPDRGAGVYNNLADMLLQQNRLDEAEAYAHRAREIFETLDLAGQPWKNLSILAQIADKRGRADEAREWRRKAQETRAAFDAQSGGQWGAAQQRIQIAQQVAQRQPIIAAVVAACKGNQKAREAIEAWLPEHEKQGDEYILVAALRKILNGERNEAKLMQDLNPVRAAIVAAVLEGLRG